MIRYDEGQAADARTRGDFEEAQRLERKLCRLEEELYNPK